MKSSFCLHVMWTFLLSNECYAQAVKDEQPGDPKKEGRTGEFTIGMFGAKSMREEYAGCEGPSQSVVTSDGRNSSTLNITSKDGFNSWQTYVQEWWTKRDFTGMLKLGASNDLRLLLSYHQYYKPAVNSSNVYLGNGTNDYDGCGHQYSECEAPGYFGRGRLNVDAWFSDLCSDKNLRNGFMGIQITEEAAFCHYYHSNSDCLGTNGWGGLTGTEVIPCWSINERGDASGDYNYVKLPVHNADEAQAHYKNLFGHCAMQDKTVSIMEAHHHFAISECSYNIEGGKPQEYIRLLNKEDRRDLFLEGSYYSFPHGSINGIPSWSNLNYGNLTTTCNTCANNAHYLGFLKSIDYSLGYSNETHKVIDVTGTTGKNEEDLYTFHSRPSQLNANWLWFQTYASIVHGAQGVWFWSHPWMFTPSESQKYTDWHYPSLAQDPFGRDGFPRNYNRWVAPLARELRYLANHGFLDSKSRMFANGDKGDTYGIINAYKFAWTGENEFGTINTFYSDYPTNWITNEEAQYRPYDPYKIRYSFHTNGEEVVMIAVNPTNSPVQVYFDFDCVGDRRISESSEFDILFAATNGNTVSWSTYKSDRTSVSLEDDVVLQKIHRSLDSEGELSVSFGALDVVVIRFDKKRSDFVQEEAWSKVWTNFGNGDVGGWGVKPWDKFFTGDFDGDGIDEILAVGNAGLSSDWYALMKYNDGQWSWLWSNYGASCALQPYHANWVVGDFDGDGKDELLGNDTWTTIFSWTGSDWMWEWSDNGYVGHWLRPFKDRMIAGDFNGDGRDEILGQDLSNGWTTMLEYDGSQMYWGYWSDNGAGSVLSPYHNKGVVGDFNGDGKDDFLGLDTWSTLCSFENGSWSWLWSTNGGSSFAGWNYPLHPVWDKVVVGNFDTDGKDELMFISTGPFAQWAMTFDFIPTQSNWSLNWVANDSYSVPFINDWPINNGSGSLTEYMSLKTGSALGDYLLARRNFSCTEEDRYLVALYAPNGNNKSRAISDISGRGNPVTTVLTLYPNPVGGQRDFHVVSSVAFDRIEVLDALGRVQLISPMVGQSLNWKGTLNGLAPGTYFIRASSGGSVVGTGRVAFTSL